MIYDQPAKTRQRTLAKAAAVRDVLNGLSIVQASGRHGLSTASVRRALATVQGVDPGKWLEALFPNYSNCGRKPSVSMDSIVWRIFKADYLRPEQPSATSCHGRLAIWCEQNNHQLPSLRQLQRKLIKLPRAQVIAARGGSVELDRMFPAQQRSVVEVAALERVSGDGWPVDVFVEHPDGRIIRPCLWVFQDVRSRKALTWCLGETESSALVLSSFRQLCMEYGIPNHLHIDNTRAVSASWLTAGTSGRKRFGDSGEFAGAFKSLGVKVHFSQLVATDQRTASGRRRNRGRGQSKPVERLFRSLADELARHPACAGFYSGASTSSKPANYNGGVAGIAWSEFESLIDSVIRRLNAKTGRQTELGAGEKSVNQVWSEALAESTVRRAVPAELDEFLAPAETVKVARDGTIRLTAGSAPSLGSNRYWSESLYSLVGQRLHARYDAADLHSSIRLFDKTGRFVCEAVCLLPAGFGDAEAAAEHNRRRREFVRLHKRADKARLKADQHLVDEVIRAEMGNSGKHQKDMPEPQVIRMVTSKKHMVTGGSSKSKTADRISRGWKKVMGGDE